MVLGEQVKEAEEQNEDHIIENHNLIQPKQTIDQQLEAIRIQKNKLHQKSEVVTFKETTYR
jgi:hypothetical protein